MKLLVIGGTQFVGRHFVDAALAAGHALTVLHRGQTGATLWAGHDQVRHVHADRKAEPTVLAQALADAGGPWDAVLDCCAYVPRDVVRLAQLLKPHVQRYLLVSSISVYASFAAPNDERSAVARIEDTDTETVDGRTYGALKALCEEALAAHWPAGRWAVVRPGLVVGPHDPTQRFTYWPARLAQAEAGQPVLAPGSPADLLRFIDARDLAAFMLHLLHGQQAGIFNVINDHGSTTVGSLLAACAEAAAVQPRFVYASAEQLPSLKLQPWTDLPTWAPPQGDTTALAEVSNQAARTAGLHCRPLLDTVRDTLAWWRSLPADQQRFSKAGLSRERESEALRALMG